jgi:hypothetical protein
MVLVTGTARASSAGSPDVKRARRRRSVLVASLGAALSTLALGGPALARPAAPSIFCKTYPDSPACTGRLTQCTLCHVSTQPVAWNEYGAALRVGADFEAELPAALKEVEPLDSDGDGVSNGDEIAAGTKPAVADDQFCPAPEAATSGDVPEGYDFALARRRVGILYCGASPSYDEAKAFSAGDPDDRTLHERLHEALDGCLAGAYWRDQGLQRIADALIRPVYAVGWDSPVGIRLADYEFDYRLWSYALTEDRDARELLTADYHVVAGADGALEKVTGTVSGSGVSGGQPLAPERRAGMITTQWFFVINTMFSALPRTTAAQAYRAYLGLDIALQQGIWPVPGEPVDVDKKGVQAETCAPCHSTLDPLAYGFAYYRGIGGGSGTYDPNRPGNLIDGWSDNTTHLLGQPVADVVEWARVASDTDYFRRQIATLLFEHALGRTPGPPDERGFVAAWQAMPEDGHSARRLIHRLVDLGAFGGVQ